MIARLLEHRRLFVTASLLLSLAGGLAWRTMPREEDPRYPNRDGVLTVAFPGADPAAVERLVLDPIEDELAELDELEKVQATARAGLVVMHIKLRDSIYDTEGGWDEVERAIARARREFPDAVELPVLDRTPYEPESIVIAVTGSSDPLRLADAADALKRELQAIPDLGRVRLAGDPGEQVLVELDDPASRRLGVTHAALAAALAARNVIVPAGSIRVGDRQLVLRPQTEFESVQEIAETPIALPSGAAIPLGSLARVRRAPGEPPVERMRLNGARAVGLSLAPKPGVDIVALGRTVRRVLADARPRYAPLEIHEVAFQPDHVESRIGDLGGSLLIGVGIVAAVLCGTMGFRLGLVVALVIPLVVLSSLAIYAAGGGVLHQISIAGLVLSLGLLVDNAIIIAESVQQKIDRGTVPAAAAVAAVRELVAPLASATGTTLAAFTPLLLAEGMAADFVRPLPVVVMLTLGMSFLFAVLVTPIFAALGLRRRARRGGSFARAVASRAAAVGVGWPGRTLAVAAVVVAVSLAATRFVEQSFFPSTERPQLVVDVELPEGAHLDGTDRAARRLEAALLRRPEVRSVAAFIGRSTPLFYYNLPRRPSSPHLAQLLVDATDRRHLAFLRQWVRGFARAEMPEAVILSRRLEQGRTTIAPIEIRIKGGEFSDRQTAAERLVAALRQMQECEDVRHDLGVGIPAVRFRVADAAAQQRGVSRADVGRALRARARGVEVGQLRAGEDPVPIIVRPSAGEDLPAARLTSVGVAGGGGDIVPLGQLAVETVTWSPGAIHHRNRTRIATVYAHLADGVPYSRVVRRISERLPSLDLPPSVRLEWGGEAEGSSEANLAILQALPVGALLLVLFILVEFNSFRRLAIVLVTVPLAAAGIVPGLLLSGQPFGFMSLLGAVSLVGIVVNNAIVLLDVVERGRAAGKSIATSLRRAVLQRTRPILLTTVTTVAGLLPLAFSASPLWPPLAWTIISGLVASTALTLVVVPSLYASLMRGT